MYAWWFEVGAIYTFVAPGERVFEHRLCHCQRLDDCAILKSVIILTSM